MKFKFLCMNLEKWILRFLNVMKYILNTSALNIFKGYKASTVFRGIFIIMWKGRQSYVILLKCFLPEKIKVLFIISSKEDLSVAA